MTSVTGSSAGLNSNSGPRVAMEGMNSLGDCLTNFLSICGLNGERTRLELGPWYCEPHGEENDSPLACLAQAAGTRLDRGARAFLLNDADRVVIGYGPDLAF